MRSWERGFGKRPSVACPFPPPPPPPYCGEENLEPTHATACNIGNSNIKRHWEDISDSDELPFTPQADLFFIGDSEGDDGDDYDEAAAFSQAHVSTQTEIASLLPGDARDSCCGTSTADDKGTPTYSEIQQLLIESQNFTIHLLCEKIGNMQHPAFGSVLNPNAEVFFPSTVAQPQKICLSELIDAEDSLPADTETLITELEQFANDAESGVEDLPTEEPESHVAVEQVLSDLQRIKAALANREQLVEDMKTELACGLNPDLLTSQVVDQVFKKISACVPDAVWCLVPSRSSCLQICEDNVILGFWDTLFFGSSLGRCATSEFPPIGLMERKNPDSLVFHRCPGCACEISGNICFACDYAEKNRYYADGFCKYSPNSPAAIDSLHREAHAKSLQLKQPDASQSGCINPCVSMHDYLHEFNKQDVIFALDSVNPQGPIDNISFETFSHHDDDVEDYMLGYDPSDDVWS